MKRQMLLFVLLAAIVWSCKKNETENIEYKVGVPTIFTPNHDDFNDTFMPSVYNFPDESVSVKTTLIIFDNNMNQVFSISTDIYRVTWDGKNDQTHKLCKDGVYSYFFKQEFANKKVVTRSGTVEIVDGME